MVLVKPAGAGASRRYRIDPRQTDLYDIYPTIMEAIGTAGPHELVGASLTKQEVQNRIRHYHFYKKHNNSKRVIEGKIARYIVTPNGLTFDREISIDR
jgi:arylsulfatase A-like enzyme